jgi:hypothetical protein
MSCLHHWVIEPPNGTERVNGRCRKCGAERDFAVEPFGDLTDFAVWYGAGAPSRRAFVPKGHPARRQSKAK